EEWITDKFSGELVGPWSRQRLVYLLDLNTMTRYTWIDQYTGGGSIAIRELTEQTELKRKWLGKLGFPKVLLRDTFMPTHWGGRQRPHLLIVGWEEPGGSPALVEDQHNPQLPPAGEKVTPPKENTKKTSTAKTVKEKPTAKEVISDEIPY